MSLCKPSSASRNSTRHRGGRIEAPLVRDGGGWRFDAAAGMEEINARRIGRNELSAQQVCLAIAEKPDDDD